MTTKYCTDRSIYENRKKVKGYLPKCTALAGSGLAGAGRGLGPQSCNLPARQGDADFADPVQLHAVDRLGVETGEVDEARAFAALDGLQIALAGLELHGCLFPIAALERVGLPAVAHHGGA